MPCWKLADRELVSDKPLVMGILNLTPDSFSDALLFNFEKKNFDIIYILTDTISILGVLT